MQNGINGETANGAASVFLVFRPIATPRNTLRENFEN